MGYLIFQILFFLLVAALLGFVIGWLLRGARFQTEIQDLDARWRSKLGEVESERDRFAGEVAHANEARAKFEASASESRRLVETHEASLQQLRREHQTKLGFLSDAEQRVASLEGDLSTRDQELTDIRDALAKQTAAAGDMDALGRELAAATERANLLERDLQTSKEANSACRNEVERLEARVRELQRNEAGSGGALGLMASSPSAATDPSGDLGGSGGSEAEAGEAAGAGGGEQGARADAAEAGGSARSGGALGLVGGTDVTSEDASGSAGGGASGGQNDPVYGQRAAAPSHLAEAGGQTFGAAETQASDSAGDDDGEGERPEALSAARGGVADDLKKISGVGPKLEKTLNGLGIFHFSQIAAFNRANVAWVDRHLRFKGRIDREKWIEQAKVLAAGGETEFSQRN